MTAHRRRGRKREIFEAVFAELHHQMKEDEHGEPQTPQHHLLHPLHVQHTEDEDELVEDEVPELILQMLFLTDSQRPEHNALNHFSYQHQDAAGGVHHHPNKQAVSDEVQQDAGGHISQILQLQLLILGPFTEGRAELGVSDGAIGTQDGPGQQEG